MTGYRVRYQSFEFDQTDIHLRSLRGQQEYSDPEGIAESLGIPAASWPHFGVVWPSSEVLAHFIVNYEGLQSKRILEIGCGLALSSHLLNKLGFNITATDRHPEVENFLDSNSKLNNDPPIQFERTDWVTKSDSLGKFDLIIGSDLLYEDDNVDLVANFIENHANPICDVILIDPGRGRVNKLQQKMNKHGFSCSDEAPIHPGLIEFDFKGRIVHFARVKVKSDKPITKY